MSEEIQKECKETFDLFDVDNNGFLDIQTTKKLINSFGIVVNDNEINQLSNDNKVFYDSFKKFIYSKMNEPKKFNLEKVFENLISKKTGNISAKKFKYYLMNFGLKISEKEADEILNEFLIDSEGNINYKEFCHAMNSK